MSVQALDSFRELLATPQPPALGPKARPGVLSLADVNARLAPLFTATKLAPLQQDLIRALLLLWHDHLDASHAIAQGAENADGNFLHAMMHRREPDYWNAKYWWRRVGAHPAFPEIARRVRELLLARGAGDLLTKLLPGGKWEAGAFVDVCEAAAGDSEREALLREIQRIETEVLLESILAR